MSEQSDTLRRIGTILPGPLERDAIHVAVLSVVSMEVLAPGQPIKFVGKGEERLVCKVSERRSTEPFEDCVGVVDPFLSGPVPAGRHFWLFLKPGTVTGIRHHWTHPALDGATTNPMVKEIEDLAAKAGYTYRALMDAAIEWVHSGQRTKDNKERYKEITDSEWRLFWFNWEHVTGRKRGGEVDDSAPFYCAC